MSVLIRSGCRRDIPYIADIERAAEALFPEGLLPETGHVYDEHSLLSAVDSQLLHVAEVDTHVAGFAVSARLGDYLHLYEMSVHPDFGRRGLGRQLVEATLSSAGLQHFPGVTLTTFDHIAWNRPFYESCGFTRLADTDLTTELADLLCQENDAGFTHRVAMLARL